MVSEPCTNYCDVYAYCVHSTIDQHSESHSQRVDHSKIQVQNGMKTIRLAHLSPADCEIHEPHPESIIGYLLVSNRHMDAHRLPPSPSMGRKSTNPQR